MQLTNPADNILPTSIAALYMHRCHRAVVAINGGLWQLLDWQAPVQIDNQVFRSHCLID